MSAKALKKSHSNNFGAVHGIHYRRENSPTKAIRISEKILTNKTGKDDNFSFHVIYPKKEDFENIFAWQTRSHAM